MSMVPSAAHIAFDSIMARSGGGSFASLLDAQELDSLADICSASGKIVRRTTFKECQRSGVLIEWARLLGFPDYYGKNWDAFDECLRDREILPRTATVFLIDDAFQFCLQESSHLLDILESVSAGRAESGYWDPSWDYPSLWIVLNFSKAQHIEEQLAARPGIIRVSRP